MSVCLFTIRNKSFHTHACRLSNISCQKLGQGRERELSYEINSKEASNLRIFMLCLEAELLSTLLIIFN